MLSRQHRFHGYNSLNHVYRHGQSVSGSLFSIRHVVNQRRQVFRAAVVVSRKVSKSAVVRNRIRRRVYGLLAEWQAEISAPHDIVISVFDERLSIMPAADLASELRGQLSRASVLPPVPPSERAIVDTKEL
jgi:ribonuclease P protein component